MLTAPSCSCLLLFSLAIVFFFLSFLSLHLSWSPGFPDTDWEYYVQTKPWPIPPPHPPTPQPGSLGGFQLPNSVSFLVNMATAMASDTSLFKLGMVSLVTTPPLFEQNLTSFEQTLDIATATVSIQATTAGGRGFSASVAVDANSNTITALLNTTVPVSLEVTVQSLHPNTTFQSVNQTL